jgi:hypothetical protein
VTSTEGATRRMVVVLDAAHWLSDFEYETVMATHGRYVVAGRRRRNTGAGSPVQV